MITSPVNPTTLPVQPLESPASIGSTDPAGFEFAEVLRGAVDRVDASSASANTMAERLIAGETQDLHTVALAGQRAALQFEMLLQVRNKIVQAYQEVMRMQL